MATMQQAGQQAQAPAPGQQGQQPGPNYPMASLYVGDLAPEVSSTFLCDLPYHGRFTWRPHTATYANLMQSLSIIFDRSKARGMRLKILNWETWTRNPVGNPWNGENNDECWFSPQLLASYYNYQMSRLPRRCSLRSSQRQDPSFPSACAGTWSPGAPWAMPTSTFNSLLTVSEFDNYVVSWLTLTPWLCSLS